MTETTSIPATKPSSTVSPPPKRPQSALDQLDALLPDWVDPPLEVPLTKRVAAELTQVQNVIDSTLALLEPPPPVDPERLLRGWDYWKAKAAEAKAKGVVVEKLLPKCPICKDMGWLSLDVDIFHDHFGEIRPCQCRVLTRNEAVIVQSGLNSGEYARMRLDTFVPYNNSLRDALSMIRGAIKEWSVNREWRGLHFFGGSGTGKTHLALAAAREAAALGRRVSVWTTTDLFNTLFNSFGAGNGDASRLQQELGTADVLVLDDVGSEGSFKSDIAERTYYGLFDQRLRTHLLTIVTTNVRFDKLAQVVGPRATSRLIGLCGNPIPLLGEDFRLREMTVWPRRDSEQNPSA